ncbi:MAG: hypothetical protein LQ350_003647 [Teloschistes chrysophthalmus]|nr:MAG: hypothetical protein LQ350_003647 [Niorma chrysophthalma]
MSFLTPRSSNQDPVKISLNPGILYNEAETGGGSYRLTGKPISTLRPCLPSSSQIPSISTQASTFILTKHYRYSLRPPRYYRGPLHPYQPPPPSAPNSREFIPGPFSLPRLQQTYISTLAPDLLSLMYTHHPPGTLPGPSGQRLRGWDNSSPYHKNRPLRPPRGRPTLPLMRRPITFRNIPRLEKIVVHHVIRDPSKRDSSYLHVAGMVLQAITNVRAEVARAKHDISNFGIRKDQTAMAVKAELRGENMYCFLSKVVDVVMPRIKEYKGVSGGSGDGSGNLAFGLQSSAVGAFPEVEVNYDS